MGKYTYTNGDSYEGEWRNDKKQGRGQYNYTNGDVYIGGWENDFKSGKGRYIYKQKKENTVPDGMTPQ